VALGDGIAAPPRVLAAAVNSTVVAVGPRMIETGGGRFLASMFDAFAACHGSIARQRSIAATA